MNIRVAPRHSTAMTTQNDGMLNVRSKRCAHPGRTKQLSFGKAGSTAEYCSGHAEDGMVDAVNRNRCTHPGCTQRPSYGKGKAGGKPEYCSGHAGGEIVLLASRRGSSGDDNGGGKREHAGLGARGGGKARRASSKKSSLSHSPAPATAPSSTISVKTKKRAAGVGGQLVLVKRGRNSSDRTIAANEPRALSEPHAAVMTQDMEVPCKVDPTEVTGAFKFAFTCDVCFLPRVPEVGRAQEDVIGAEVRTLFCFLIPIYCGS